MKDSSEAVEKFKNYVTKHKCSSFYIEFDKQLDKKAEVMFKAVSKDEWLVVIKSLIFSSVSEYGTDQHFMTYNDATDSLEINTGSGILNVMCD